MLTFLRFLMGGCPYLSVPIYPPALPLARGQMGQMGGGKWQMVANGDGKWGTATWGKWGQMGDGKWGTATNFSWHRQATTRRFP